MKKIYREEARLAQRWFTLEEDRVDIDGRDRGRKFSRGFQFSELSTSTQHFVTLRHDMMWRCLSLMTVSIVLASVVARIDSPLGLIGLCLCLFLVAKFAWLAFGWARQKLEVEIFQHSDGSEAFAIFNDKSGDPEFTEFVRLLKSGIAAAEKRAK